MFTILSETSKSYIILSLFGPYLIFSTIPATKSSGINGGRVQPRETPKSSEIPRTTHLGTPQDPPRQPMHQSRSQNEALHIKVNSITPGSVFNMGCTELACKERFIHLAATDFLCKLAIACIPHNPITTVTYPDTTREF